MPKAVDTRITGCARTPTSRRRLLSGAAAALTGAGFAGVVLSPDPTWGNPAEPTGAGYILNPDAALIAACDAYIRAMDAYNRHGGDVDCEDDPLWHALQAAEERAADIPAETMAGLAAKARAAAATGRMPDGVVRLGESYAGHWPARLVRDVLRLSGAEVPA